MLGAWFEQDQGVFGVWSGGGLGMVTDGRGVVMLYSGCSCSMVRVYINKILLVYSHQVIFFFLLSSRCHVYFNSRDRCMTKIRQDFIGMNFKITQQGIVLRTLV